MFSLVQLFALGLAALTTGSGLQASTAGNVGLSRHVAGQALMAFAVPALALPLGNAGPAATKNGTSAAEPDCDEDDSQDEEDDFQDDSQDNEDDSKDSEDDSRDDEADEADDGDDSKYDEDNDDEE
ncbi:hypothetical protein F5883DRAFT_544924 [Diaporthe sp. PMI_573]|nr:hypothetical protein F5883DRAFT_544924 [Diaporthaceae sp. PMI_573]